MDNNDLVLTTEEVAQELHINRQTVRKYCRLGYFGQIIRLHEGNGTRYRIPSLAVSLFKKKRGRSSTSGQLAL